MSEPRPSDICLTLASVTEADWLSADEIRGRLERLGFTGFSAQQVSSWLRRLTRMDAPPVEARVGPWGGGYLEFHVTPWAARGSATRSAGRGSGADAPQQFQAPMLARSARLADRDSRDLGANARPTPGR